MLEEFLTPILEEEHSFDVQIQQDGTSRHFYFAVG
jgi:hypothetical protein